MLLQEVSHRDYIADKSSQNPGCLKADLVAPDYVGRQGGGREKCVIKSQSALIMIEPYWMQSTNEQWPLSFITGLVDTARSANDQPAILSALPADVMSDSQR